jgi:hypothetical protein
MTAYVQMRNDAMFRPEVVVGLILVAAVSVLWPGVVVQAQAPDFFIDIQPNVGPPGTTVTITGRDAPPNTPIQVLFAPFTDPAQCRLGRGADLVAEITSDRDGSFVATHLTGRLSGEHAGNSYVARVNTGPTPRPASDIECFTFGATDGQYFPETGHVLKGRFQEYWRENGGLAVFGYPLTDEFQQDGRITQYFERARFEFFPENQPPYDVLLGRLGVVLLQREGVNWREQPTAPGPATGCLYFEETQHNLCNQQRGTGFLNYWQSNGLEFDGQPGSSYRESLALFGFPITEPYQYTNESGDTVQVQWFERARFEWHPDNPEQYRVLLGRLGAVLVEAGAGP